jgi:hypothetical protein
MTADSKSPVRIIFVPGIRPKPHPEDHARQLRRCLKAGFVRAGGDPAAAAELAAAFSLMGWSYDFYGEHGDIGADVAGIERLLRGEDDEKADKQEASSFGRRVVAWLYALADYFPVLGTTFSTRRMQTRVQEIKRYFRDADGESTAVRGILKDALRDAWSRGERVAIMGHSFGSVIAYDALWELSRESAAGRVDLFLTMGSPLTMHYINHHLKGVDRQGAQRYPNCIGRWINLAAVGEVTALDRKMSDRFRPMLKYGLIESIEDDLQLVNQFRGPDGLNVHKCYGYLASTELGRILRSWYAGDGPAV